MALSKDIYKKAKEQFKKDLSSENGPFKSPVGIDFPKVQFAGKNQEVIDLTFNVNDFTTLSITSLRMILQDPLAFTDPADNLEKFGNIARAIRLNNFKEYGKNFDLGFGNGSSNNLIYKLATYYLKDSDLIAGDKSIQNPQEILSKSKSLVIQACLQSDRFNELIKNQLLDDIDTYGCLTRQAFYSWHYENFVKGTPSANDLGPANAVDGSITSWTNVAVKRGEIKSFVAKDGGPFNSGYPTLCVILLADKDKIKTEQGQSDIFNSAYEYVSLVSNRKIETDKDKKFIDTPVFNHKKDNFNPNPSFSEKSVLQIQSVKENLVKVCLGFDYANLITMLKPVDISPKRSVVNFIDYAINLLPNGPAAEKIFQSSNEQQTSEVILAELEKVTKTLSDKNESVQNGPALFFDVKKDPDITNIQELAEEYEDISESTSDIILKRQYSLNLENISSTMKGVYQKLLSDYLQQRSVDPRISSSDLYDREQLIENIIFYYDSFYNLLAIGASPRKVTKTEPEITETRFQQNNIPFEYSEGENQTLSVLDPVYSVNPYSINEDGGIYTGLSGPLLLVTQYYVDLLEENFEKIEGKPANLTKENVFYQKNEKTNIQGSLPRIIPFKDLGDLTFGSNQIFKNVLLKTSNSFFTNASEVNLASSVGDIYDLSTKALKTTTSFLTGNQTFLQAGIASVDDIQSFLERFHYPTLFAKPTVPKQKDTGEPDSGLTKEKYDNSPRSNKEKKSKKYDLNNYNSSSKMFNKEILLVVASASKDPSLCGLGDIVSGGDLKAIFEFLLTKFSWRDILAKSLLSELKKVADIGSEEDIKDLANKINACLADQGIGKILADFANFTSLFNEFDKIVESKLPDIPKLSFSIPYIFVLDFEKFARKFLEDAIKEAILAALQAILAIVLKDLCELAEDISLETLIYDKLNAKDTPQFGKEVPLDASVRSTALNTANTSGLDSGSVFIDLVSLLKASNLDDLDNILNGLLDLFPILRVKIENDLQRDPLIVMEEVLDNLSEVTIAQETKSLLIGTAINQTYNKVINYSDTDLVIQGVLNNINSINLFYDYLSQFINLEIINQKIVDSTIITPDPCFINFGSLSAEDLQTIKDFLGDNAADDYVDSVINDSVKKITDLCSKFSNGKYDVSVDLPNLVSNNSKKSLQSVVDATLEPVVATQKSIISSFSSDDAREGVRDLLTILYLNADLQNNPNSKIIAEKDKPILDSTPPLGVIEDLISGKGVETSNYVKSQFLNSNLVEVNKFFNKSLNSNFGNFNQKKVYSSSNSTSPFDETTRQSTVIGNDVPNITNFFEFFTYWLLRSGEVGVSDFITAIDILNDPAKFKDFIESSFKSADEIKTDARSAFDSLVNEGGKNSNFYVTNIQKMRQIIKAVK